MKLLYFCQIITVALACSEWYRGRWGVGACTWRDDRWLVWNAQQSFLRIAGGLFTTAYKTKSYISKLKDCSRSHAVTWANGYCLCTYDLYFCSVTLLTIYIIIKNSEQRGERTKQVAQLSQRDRAAGWISYGQKWKTVTERQYFTDIIGLSSTTVT